MTQKSVTVAASPFLSARKDGASRRVLKIIIEILQLLNDFANTLRIFTICVFNQGRQISDGLADSIIHDEWNLTTGHSDKFV